MTEVFICRIDDCQECFDTLRGLGVHMAEIHGLDRFDRIEKFTEWGYTPTRSTLQQRLYELNQRLKSYDEGGV